MKSTRNLSLPRNPHLAQTTVCCDVAGHGQLRMTAEMLPALRQKPGPLPGDPLPPSFLKHADEQTVAGVAAVFQAIDRFGLKGTPFTDWGVLAAPRFLGRASLAVGLHRYKLEGAWGISPHLIPHHSLHSTSGTVSQALKIHGPNFGVGGGPHAADEGFLTAAALLAGDRVPGVWLILTGHDPELVPVPPEATPPTGPTSPMPCGAVALALVPARPGSHQLKLHVSAGAADADEGVAGPEWAPPLFTLEALLDALSGPDPAGAWRLHCGGAVELKRHGAGAEN